LVLVDLGLDIPVESDGRFSIGRIRTGEYEVMFVDNEQEAGPFTITVPSDSYNLTV
jgi:hypothetical protein